MRLGQPVVRARRGERCHGVNDVVSAPWARLDQLHVAQQTTSAALPSLLTPAEVAAWLKTTISAVYAKAERGSLPGATRLGRRLYFIHAELLAYVEQGRVSQSGGPGGGT